jgi:UDPglucose 6-dehydrogenase
MADNKQIALYGYGYVGRALYRFLKDHYDVLVIDPHVDFALLKEEEPEAVPGRYAAEYQASAGIEHGVICVPTPTGAGGWSCDTSIVEDVFRNTDHRSYLIKSTCGPGTIDRLTAETGKRVCFSPEYIGEGKYEIAYWKDFPHPTDMKKHSFHIFGGPRDVTREWVQIFQRVAGWNARYMQTTALQAELVKYCENMFLATKKIFCDEMYNVCEAFGADYNEVKELWLLDGRVGPAMTLIHPDSRGFGGKCLPKDTQAIVAAARAKGYDPKLWAEVIASNQRVKGSMAGGGHPEKAEANQTKEEIEPALNKETV